MKAIVRWSLWQRKGFIIGWGIFVFSIIAVKMVAYPSFRDQAEQLQKQFENLPPAMLQLVGGSSDFFSPVGFINSQIYFFVLPLILCIVSVIVFAGAVAKEEDSGSIENILSRPLSRGRFIVAKYIYAVSITFILAFVALVTTVISVRIVDVDIDLKNVFVASLVSFLLSIACGSISFMLASAWASTRRFAVGTGLFLSIGGFIISSLAATVSWLKGTSRIFPFDYYKSEDILYGRYHFGAVWLYLAILIICFCLAIYFFNKRDLSNQ